MTRTLSSQTPEHRRFAATDAAIPGTVGLQQPRLTAPLSFAAVTACIILVAIDLRPGIVSIGPLLPQIRQAFDLSNAEASLMTAIPAMLMGALAFPTPWLAQRFGRDRVIIVALAVLMLSTAMRAFAGSIGLLLATTAGVGAGIAVAGALIPGFAKKSFPKRAAVLMGLYAMSLGLGSTIAAGLSAPLANLEGSWRFGAGIFALPCLIAIAAWLFVARTERVTAAAMPNSPAAAAGTARLPVRNAGAWLLALYFSANNILFFGFVSWTAPIFREHGMSTTTAGLVLASFTAAFMIANPIAGLISGKEDRRLVIGIFAGLALIGSVGVAIHAGSTSFLFIPVIACGVGGSFTLGMILPLDNATTAGEANAWTAFVMGIGYFAGALGPLGLGILRDMTGGFDVPLWVLAAVALLMFALTPFLHPNRDRYAHRGVPNA